MAKTPWVLQTISVVFSMKFEHSLTLIGIRRKKAEMKGKRNAICVTIKEIYYV